MSICFSKSPDYESTDKVRVDINIEGDDIPLDEIVTTFVDFLCASGFSRTQVIRVMYNLEEDYREELPRVNSGPGGYPTELL
jgi:hypothetical protein